MARHKTVFRFLGGLLLLGLLSTYAWYVSRPTLVWYQSPPLDKAGHRLLVLVPRGWSLYQEATTAPGSGGAFVAYFVSPKQKPRIPRWLWWLLDRPEGRDGYLMVGASKDIPDLPTFGAVIDGREHAVVPSLGDPMASRVFPSQIPQYYVGVGYSVRSTRLFDASRSAICNSLRVLQPGERL